jgi:serine/threonine protein kinase
MSSLEAGLENGSLLGGYRIESFVARGGMGVVYKATQLALERIVALKVVAPELADDQGFRERFKREALLAASLDHPNILPVYETGEVDGHLFLAMRYVVGTDMDSLIRRERVLMPDRAVAIVAQVGAALDAAHGRGLVHRDVKPANILIAEEYAEERAYLTDFGLTKNLATDAHLTKTGQMVGTLDYVAPEQVLGRTVDGRADTYALACVLYRAVTGRVPFGQASDAAKMRAHLNEPPPSAAKASPAVPTDLDFVIRRGMAKRPEDRYASSGDFAAAARAAIGTPGPALGRASSDATQPDPTVVDPLVPAQRVPVGAEAKRSSSWPPGGRRAAYGAGVVLVLVVGAIIALVAGGGGGKRSSAREASSSTASTAATTTATQPTTSTSTVDAQAAAYHAQVSQITPRLNRIFGHLPNGHDFLKPIFSRTALADAARVRGIADSLNALSPPPQLLTDHEALVAHLGEMEQALRSLAVDSDNHDFTGAYRDIAKLKAANRRVTTAVRAVKAAGNGTG